MGRAAFCQALPAHPVTMSTDAWLPDGSQQGAPGSGHMWGSQQCLPQTRTLVKIKALDPQWSLLAPSPALLCSSQPPPPAMQDPLVSQPQKPQTSKVTGRKQGGGPEVIMRKQTGEGAPGAWNLTHEHDQRLLTTHSRIYGHLRCQTACTGEAEASLNLWDLTACACLCMSVHAR